MPWIIHAFELFEESNEEDEELEEEEDDGDEQIAMAGTTKSESKV